MEVIGYVRVSTDEQVKGSGLDVQREAIEAHCAGHGQRLVRVYGDEGVSGSNGLDSRTGLAEALAAIEAGGASALVVYRLDRLARDLILQETVIAQLERVDVSVISTSEDVESLRDDPGCVMMRQILGAVAQYERTVIRGRMAAGLAVKRRNGGYVGGKAPMGLRPAGGELVANPAEQAAVARIGELRAAGASYRRICEVLTVEGVSTRGGGRWLPATVRRIAGRSPVTVT